MPIIINNIRSSLNANEDEIIRKALASVGIKDAIEAKIYKTSLDARKHNDIHFVHSVYAIKSMRFCVNKHHITIF